MFEETGPLCSAIAAIICVTKQAPCREQLLAAFAITTQSKRPLPRDPPPNPVSPWVRGHRPLKRWVCSRRVTQLAMFRPLVLQLLCSCFAGLVLADYGSPPASCTPHHHTLTIISTTVQTDLQQVTQVTAQHSHVTAFVTSVVMKPTTVTTTSTLTKYPPPLVLTHTSFITDTMVFTTYETSLATSVVTHTTHLLASAVVVTEATVTQTAVQPQSLTHTISVTNVAATFTTTFVTNTFTVFVTETSLEPFLVTKTTTSTVYQPSTFTTTAITTTTVHATTTITDHQYVTKCYQPKVTYGH
ncbi:hypothetical protein E2C01_071852 [Portunus trituberculatus]|uniref:Uncharacterized protein n=1 Tax=Portunus trituberculatus TaxID=210409 RepID=A0A5B7I678_PORTR|nr:hypothetical protein [Portunus trituberculatus]